MSGPVGDVARCEIALLPQCEIAIYLHRSGALEGE